MVIGPGPDQLGLRDNVRDVLAAECPPDLARQAMTDPQCWHGLWKSVVGLGWPGLADSESGAIDLAVVLEECGAALAPIDIEAALAAPLMAAAAELVGVAAAALRRSVDHAKSRTQFGRPIGSFQGVKHALADNHVAVERARSLTYAAAARLDDPATAPGEAWRGAALAKAAAGDAAVNCSRSAVQVHGAIAQTWEHDMHLYIRRAWQGAALLGDSRALYGAAGRRFVAGDGRCATPAGWREATGK